MDDACPALRLGAGFLLHLVHPESASCVIDNRTNRQTREPPKTQIFGRASRSDRQVIETKQTRKARKRTVLVTS